MFVVKNDDGKNDHKRYKSIYFNYFLISYYRVRLFLAMQVRVMAACMESQSNIRSAQSRPRDGRGASDVCESNTVLGSQLHASLKLRTGFKMNVNATVFPKSCVQTGHRVRLKYQSYLLFKQNIFPNVFLANPTDKSMLVSELLSSTINNLLFTVRNVQIMLY